MNSTIEVADLHFEVRRSDARKTLGITVDRRGELILSAPHGCEETVLRDFAREKLMWVYSKLAEKEMHRTPPPKEYVSGEGFQYLGRSYRLLLVSRQDVPLKLERGRFKLLRVKAGQGRQQFIRWYTEHAEVWLKRRVVLFADRVGVKPAGVDVRDLGFRWGSCGKKSLNFHWATILLPPRLVEYVVVHELVHIRHPLHDQSFWLAVERAMPDYAQRRDDLRGVGATLSM